MHKIKQAARRDAQNPEYETKGTRLLSRFGRYSRRPYVLTDEEFGMRIACTDPGPSPIAKNDSHDLSPAYDGQSLRLPRSHTDPLPAVTLEKNQQWYDAMTKDDAKVKATLADCQQLQKEDSINSAAAPKTEPEKRTKRLPPFAQKWKNKLAKARDKCDQRGRYRPRFTLRGQLKSSFGSWTSVLFAFVPIGFALYYTHQPPVAVFIVNFFAIIPSSTLVTLAIEELTLYLGDVLGGLLSMTFSNSVQLISSIFLLKSGQIEVLRASLLGGILQSLLVMTGLSFLLGGYNRLEQFFNADVARAISMLLWFAIVSLTIPTVSQLWAHTTPAGILAQSRGASVVTIFSYCLWLVFSLRTHWELFRDESPTMGKRRSAAKDDNQTLKGIAMIGAASGAATAGGTINQENLVQETFEEELVPSITRSVAVCTLVVFTTLLAFNVEFATNSIQGMVAQHHVSSLFVGIVILPLLNIELLPIQCAMADNLDRSIALTLERCMQTALMVVPLTVMLSWWGVGSPAEMTLDFHGFSIAAVFASMIIVTYVVQYGRSDWLTGAVLLQVFVIIGLATFYVHDA